MGNAFFFTSALVALCATQAGAHLIMAEPKPFGSPDNSPLSSSGADFPCKVTGDATTFFAAEERTEMAAGESQKLSFKGSAVHGGGSCQLAITSDLEPTASSVWQVILSIEGGCPSLDGSGPSTYDYKIPDGITAGDYVFAWTWISKLAGQPEYYMNCAPITVTGAIAKRGANHPSTLRTRAADLPDLFVANLASVNSCKAGPGIDVVYPDPGPNVMKPEGTRSYQNISGDCSPGGADGLTSGSGESSPASGSSGSGSDVPAAGSSSSTTAPSSSAVTSAPAASSNAPAPTTPVTSSRSQNVVIPVPLTSASASASAPASTGTSPTTGSSAPSSSARTSDALSGACTSEGVFNCIGGQTYQVCASGRWTVVRAMAPGTKCADGQSTTLWARDGRVLRAFGV